MGRSFVRHVMPDGEHRYLIWSSIVDAPITYGATLEQIRNYWKEEHGRRGLEDLDRDIFNNPDSWWTDLREVSGANRAGEGETKLTDEQIVKHYFLDKPKPPPPKGEDWQKIFDREEKRAAQPKVRRR